ncbi:MAG: TolC family protein, partial [Bacteroidaceae bacterium]|nr:TolC family protein [Bacteroidaceae bacterium]
QSGYYPRLSVGGGVGASYYKTGGYTSMSFGRQMKDNLSQYVGLNLSIPIFDRFGTRNQVRMARLQLHTQQLQMEETKKNLYKEIQQAYYNALAAQKKCASSDAALASSRTSFDLMQRKYENGKATVTEYEEARNKLINAEATALQSRYTFLFRQKIIEFYRTSRVE